MSKLEKYSSYKNSGVEWLGKIPEGWKVKKLKFLGKIFAGLSDKKGDDFSKEYDSSKKEFIPFTNICNNVKIDNHQVQYVNIKANEKQNTLQKNDILFLMSSETLDDIGKCSIFLHDGEFYLNSFCKGYRLFSDEVHPEYINYLLQSKSYRVYFSIVGRGFTRINIKQEYINDVFSFVPPKKEQINISLFLDTRIEQLDDAIKQKEQLISLLKERRQILINDAVTKGIDKAVDMKDTNFKWLGMIPKHWELKALKYILKERIELSGTGAETLFMMSQVHGLVVRSDYHAKAVVAQSSIGNKKVYKYDLVFNKLKAHLGVFSKSNINEVGIVSPDYAVYYSIGDIENVKYLEHLFKTQIYISHFISKATGIVEGLIRLYTDDLFSLKVPVPPKVEQEAILKYIETNSKKIDKAIDLQQQQITKLEEYKITLIDSVVTGKVRVCDE